MKCPEVEELMQRHLDSDLEEREEEQLLSHIRECPDCAALFQSLSRLSEGLAALPSVTPPFSIVDSILPQLEQLDGQQSDPVHKASNPAADVKKPERRRKYIWTTLSGVAAAGIALGMFIFSLDGPGSKNADMALFDSESSNMESSGSMSQDNEDKKRSLFSISEQDGETGPDAGGAAMGSMLEEPAERSQPASDEANEAQRKATPPVESIPPSPPADNYKEKITVHDQHGGAAETGDPAASTPDEAPPATDANPGSEAVPPDAGGLGFRDDSEDASNEAAENNEDMQENTLAPPAEEEHREPEALYDRLLSPDENNFAYVEEQRVFVRASDGEIVFASVRKWNPGDTVRFVAWLNDKELVYQVNNESGDVMQYIVDIELQSETEKNN